MESNHSTTTPFFKTKLHCTNLSENDNNKISVDGVEISLVHREGEPRNVNRLLVSEGGNMVEIAPSRGFSIMQAHLNEQQIFWDNPSPLYNPDELALTSDEIRINGEPMKGFTYIKTYTAGIELLGLDNWGMPRENEEGEWMVLHGEASNVPTAKAEIEILKDSVVITGKMIIRDYKGDKDPWYERGEPKYEVTKEIILYRDQFIIKQVDTIRNITEHRLVPDWGYHITFKPKSGAVYLVPSKVIENRGGGKIDEGFEVWTPSPGPSRRIEKGIIHKLMRVTSGLIDNSDGIISLVKYPDSTGIAVATTPSPYYQTWFCSGGKGSDEFTFKDGKPVLNKNWDGIGIETGSSPLDHDCNICPDIDYRSVLKPGEAKRLKIMIELLDKENCRKLEDNIREYNTDRKRIE